MHANAKVNVCIDRMWVSLHTLEISEQWWCGAWLEMMCVVCVWECDTHFRSATNSVRARSSHNKKALRRIYIYKINDLLMMDFRWNPHHRWFLCISWTNNLKRGHSKTWCGWLLWFHCGGFICIFYNLVGKLPLKHMCIRI